MWVYSHAFSWLRGWDSNPGPMDYTCLQVSLKGGLYHHPCGCGGLRARFREAYSFRIVSEPCQTRRQTSAAGYRVVTDVRLPVNSPRFHPGISVGSCYLDPLSWSQSTALPLSYLGIGCVGSISSDFRPCKTEVDAVYWRGFICEKYEQIRSSALRAVLRWEVDD